MLSVQLMLSSRRGEMLQVVARLKTGQLFSTAAESFHGVKLLPPAVRSQCHRIEWIARVPITSGIYSISSYHPFKPQIQHLHVAEWKRMQQRAARRTCAGRTPFYLFASLLPRCLLRL